MSRDRVPLRIPLHVGASSLQSFVVGSVLVVPGAALTALGFVIFGGNDATALLGFVGLGMVGVSALSWRNAWRERPSDLLFDDDELHVEGGPHHGLALRWDAIAVVALAKHGDDQPHVLTLIAKDETSTELAASDDPSEVPLLQNVADALTVRARARAVDEHAPSNEPRETPTRSIATLLAVPRARATTTWTALGGLALALALPATAIATHRLGVRGHGSFGAYVELLAVSLLLSTNGYLLARARMVDRRTLAALLPLFKWTATDPRPDDSPAIDAALLTRANTRHRLWLAMLATLPFFALTFLTAKKVSRAAASEAPTPEAHGFEASAAPSSARPELAGAAPVPADAQDVQMIPTDHGDGLSYSVDTPADEADPAKRGSTLFLDGKPLIVAENGTRIRSASYERGGGRVAYTSLAKDGVGEVKVIFTDRGRTPDTAAQVVAEWGSDPAWSPAGDRLAFTIWTNTGSRVAEVLTPKVKEPPYPNTGFGAAIWLTEAGEKGRSPAWNRDGSQLAFVKNVGADDPIDRRQVFVVNMRAYGAKPRQLTRGDQDCSALEWTNDGWIRFIAENREQRVKP